MFLVQDDDVSSEYSRLFRLFANSNKSKNKSNPKDQPEIRDSQELTAEAVTSTMTSAVAIVSEYQTQITNEKQNLIRDNDQYLPRYMSISSTEHNRMHYDREEPDGPGESLFPTPSAEHEMSQSPLLGEEIHTEPSPRLYLDEFSIHDITPTPTVSSAPQLTTTTTTHEPWTPGQTSEQYDKPRWPMEMPKRLMDRIKSIAILPWPETFIVEGLYECPFCPNRTWEFVRVCTRHLIEKHGTA